MSRSFIGYASAFAVYVAGTLLIISSLEEGYVIEKNVSPFFGFLTDFPLATGPIIRFSSVGV